MTVNQSGKTSELVFSMVDCRSLEVKTCTFTSGILKPYVLFGMNRASAIDGVAMECFRMCLVKLGN